MRQGLSKLHIQTHRLTERTKGHSKSLSQMLISKIKTMNKQGEKTKITGKESTESVLHIV